MVRYLKFSSLAFIPFIGEIYPPEFTIICFLAVTKQL